MKVASSHQVSHTKDAHSRSHLIGHVLMRRGQCKKDQIDFLLKIQCAYRSIGKRIPLGELLVNHRVVTPLALTEALAIQEEMPEGGLTQILDALSEMPTGLTRGIP